MNQRINLGYTITDSLHIGNTEFVIGYNPNSINSYVVWECLNNSYYFGNYVKTRIVAEQNLLKRALNALKL